MKSFEILISVHDGIARDRIRKKLSDHPGFHLIDSVGDTTELLTSLDTYDPDLLILDMEMPDIKGVITLREIHDRHPEMNILTLGKSKDSDVIRRVMQEEIEGYLHRKSALEELLVAVRAVSTGHRYLCDESLLSLVKEEKEKRGNKREEDLLTDRELEVLHLICREFTNREIAEKLGISVRTVDAHRRNILQKTGARNTAGLVKYAFKNRLFQL